MPEQEHMDTVRLYKRVGLKLMPRSGRAAHVVESRFRGD